METNLDIFYYLCNPFAKNSRHENYFKTLNVNPINTIFNNFFNPQSIMSPLIINIVGYAAAICMVCGYLPQAIYTIRTRDTDGIAMPTFLLLAFGSIFFVIQGCMLGNWPLIITNTITTVSSAIVFAIKIKNDYFKGKKR